MGAGRVTDIAGMGDITAVSPAASARRAAPQSRKWWRGLVLPAVLAAGWSVIAHLPSFHSQLLVPLDTILLAPFVDESGRQIWLGLAESLARFAAGFAVGAIGGVTFGLVIGASGTADRVAGPSFHALRQIALFAWIPLLSAWFGNGEGAKIVYVALSAFFPAALNTHDGLRTIPIQYLELAKVMGFSQRQRVRRLLLPGALPSIFIGIQIALITAWIGTVGAEYVLGVGQGLGTFIAEARGQFRMDLVLLGVLALALVGFVINAACRFVFARLLRWQGAAS
jgi:sulfonate transport system permease protein